MKPLWSRSCVTEPARFLALAIWLGVGRPIAGAAEPGALDPAEADLRPVAVEVVDRGDGTFDLLRGGESYFVKGAGAYDPDFYAELARRGGNSVRVWGTDASTPRVLRVAHEHGLTVMLGLWLPHKGSGFDYADEAAVGEMVARFRESVLLHKDHPALLAWAIGNEMEVGYPDRAPIYAAVNAISRMIHETDGNHPTLTVTASIAVDLANTIAKHAPDLDLLGVNMYAGIHAVPKVLAASEWRKPYMLTEWGPNGDWEVARTSWGDAIEPHSSAKAEMFRDRYREVIIAHPGECLGSYAFVWAGRTGGRPNWFNLFIEDDALEAVDELQYAWTGRWPANRAPRVVSIRMDGRAPEESVVVTRAEGTKAEMIAEDPDSDRLTYEFAVRPESGDRGIVPDPERTVHGIPGILAAQEGGEVSLRFSDEHNFRSFRLYALARDGQGHAATAVFPFRVEFAPVPSGGEGILHAVKDACVRDGFYADKAMGKSDPLRLASRFSAMEGYRRETYVGFSLSEAPRAFRAVTLSLYGSGPRGAVTEAFGLADAAWEEQSITWEHRPQGDETALGEAALEEEAESWIDWDVTGFVAASLARGAESVTFILRRPSRDDGGPVVWRSRESGLHPPRLVFRHEEAEPRADAGDGP